MYSDVMRLKLYSCKLRAQSYAISRQGCRCDRVSIHQFACVTLSMKNIAEIKEYLKGGQFEFSYHAFKRAVERNISESEIGEVVENVAIIEDYPDDKYVPSCLLLGFTKLGRPIHIQVTRIETGEGLIKVITMYQPDEEKWINNYSVRR